MKISVTNLGPIKEATVELGGLTVFVGPNGTGKSYLAKVLYGLQRHETITFSYFNHADRFYQLLFGKNISTKEEAVELLQQLTPAALIQALPALANLHAELFKDRLGDFFNDDSNLFANTTISYAALQDMPEEPIKTLINAAVDYAKALLNTQSSPVEHLLWGLCWHIFWSYHGGLADYFPAARSNFMLTYKALYRARADEHVGLDSISDKMLLPGLGSVARKTGALIRFDKPTEDFIARLYDLDSSTQMPLAMSAAQLAKRLYGEEQFLVEQSEGALPDFRYQVRDAKNKIRLHLASSMVTETSPLLMGFKHWVQPNSLVIIDEPESHLHPEAQRDLINGLADAVNKGLKLILITHSPYILSCVNNLIKFGSLINKFPNDEHVAQLTQENPDMAPIEKPVCAYHFGLDGLVKNIVRDSGLIDEAEFTQPFDKINALYETMRDIEWEHRG